MVGIARWVQASHVCRLAYEYCMLVDLRDVLFQADPFAPLVHEHGHATDLVLSCEGATLMESHFSREWARKCYGAPFLWEHRERCIVNSGAIMGTPAVFELLAQELTHACPLTADVFHGRDQILLNGILYSGRLRNMYAAWA